jgi:hypothetical protein
MGEKLWIGPGKREIDPEKGRDSPEKGRDSGGGL